MLKAYLSGLIIGALMLILAGGCASSSSQTLTQPPMTTEMKKAVGTPNELSPLAPPEARNIRKVGNTWQCDVKGKTMIYDDAKACWQPQAK